MDNFALTEHAHNGYYFNAAGALQVGSTGATVKQLQSALNLLGASPKLNTDGNFGSLTKSAVLSKGFNYPVDTDTMEAIMAKAYPNVVKSDNKFDWNKLIDLGVNIWGTKAGAGAGDKPVDANNLPQDDPKPDDKWLGMPKPIVIIGGIVLAGLAVWGGAVLIKKANAGKAQPTMASQPQLAIG